jgi:hypothetical protein
MSGSPAVSKIDSPNMKYKSHGSEISHSGSLKQKQQATCHHMKPKHQEKLEIIYIFSLRKNGWTATHRKTTCA